VVTVTVVAIDVVHVEVGVVRVHHAQGHAQTEVPAEAAGGLLQVRQTREQVAVAAMDLPQVVLERQQLCWWGAKEGISEESAGKRRHERGRVGVGVAQSARTRKVLVLISRSSSLAEYRSAAAATCMHVCTACNALATASSVGGGPSPPTTSSYAVCAAWNSPDSVVAPSMAAVWKSEK
jgi:hypothetical protein